MALTLVGNKTVTVREGDWDVDTSLTIMPGDTLIFNAWGSIWAGVWFTGLNGPRGWNNVETDPKFPLPNTHPYCLLAKLDAGYFYIGDNYRIDQAATGGKLFLRINDDVPGNGSGAFTCHIQLYRG